jgi:hypothetical protein
MIFSEHDEGSLWMGLEECKAKQHHNVVQNNNKKANTQKMRSLPSSKAKMSMQLEATTTSRNFANSMEPKFSNSYRM